MPTMNVPLTLGISPCPNDTFIFEAWTNGRLGRDAPAVETRLEDIDTLNRLALQSALDVVKISFFTYIKLREQYQLLQTGGALGRGCGPLLMSRNARLTKQDLANEKLRVAVPGDLTTAHLLLRLYQPAVTSVLSLPFDQIMPALAQGEIDAGVIIHEGRFTYHQYGLHVMTDLGAWWEQTTGHPIPLGCIVARSSLGPNTIGRLEHSIHASLMHARQNPGDSREYIRSHAQEMDQQVIEQHIELYVNRFTEGYGTEGRAAIECLFERAREANLF